MAELYLKIKIQTDKALTMSTIGLDIYPGKQRRASEKWPDMFIPIYRSNVVAWLFTFFSLIYLLHEVV